MNRSHNMLISEPTTLCAILFFCAVAAAACDSDAPSTIAAEDSTVDGAYGSGSTGDDANDMNAYGKVDCGIEDAFATLDASHTADGAAGNLNNRAPDTCETLLDTIRERALAEMNAGMDRALAEVLATRDEDQIMCWMWGEFDSGSAASQGLFASGDETAEDGNGEVPETRQTTAPDEAAFVASDDEYIYILDDHVLRIVRMSPPTEAAVVGEVAIVGDAKRLYIKGDHAIVYSANPHPEPAADEKTPYRPSYWQVPQSCTYFGGCEKPGDGNDTILSIINIRDRTHPKVLRKIELPSSYVGSRMVDGTVFYIFGTKLKLFPAVHIVPENIDMCVFAFLSEPTGETLDRIEQEVRESFALLRQENTRIIAGADLADLLTPIGDTAGPGGPGTSTFSSLASCNRFTEASRTAGTELTTVLAISLENPGPVQVTTIVARPETVYATTDALYVTSLTHHSPQNPTDSLTTLIHKFTLSPTDATATYAASGEIEGHVLNRFSMDEYDGHLRVASSTRAAPETVPQELMNPTVNGAVTVLRQIDASLDAVGILDDIAPTEDIRAVRFDGTRAFISTFKDTGSLIVLDLLNHHEPKIATTSAINGPATCIRLLDSNHLVALGQDAVRYGDRTQYENVTLELFHIGDNDDLARTHYESFTGASEALNDCTAFSLDIRTGLLVLPLLTCTTNEISFNGLKVFDVSPDAGFFVRGSLHQNALFDRYTCSTEDARVRRGIVKENYLHALSNNRITISNLDKLTESIREIALGY